MTSTDPLTSGTMTSGALTSADPATSATPPSIDAGRQAQRLRTELAATLAAIEDKVNLPKRLRRGIGRMSRENPLALAAIGVASAAAVAGAAWAAVAWLKNRG